MDSKWGPPPQRTFHSPFNTAGIVSGDVDLPSPSRRTLVNKDGVTIGKTSTPRDGGRTISSLNASGMGKSNSAARIPAKAGGNSVEPAPTTAIRKRPISAANLRFHTASEWAEALIPSVSNVNTARSEAKAGNRPGSRAQVSPMHSPTVRGPALALTAPPRVVTDINGIDHIAEWFGAAKTEEREEAAEGKMLPSARPGSSRSRKSAPHTTSPRHQTYLDGIVVKLGKPLPASAIPVKYHRTREGPVPPEGDSGADTTFNPSTRHWKLQWFPSQLPTTRDEVIQLSSVLDQLLGEIDVARMDDGPDAYSSVGGHQSDVSIEIRSVMDSFANNILVDLPAWEVVLFEIVRQCFVHCEDRGVLLERVRNRYLNLRHEIAAFAAGVKETVGKAKAAQEEAVAEKEAAEESVRKIQAQLDEVYVGGGPEREASLRSMVTAMNNMNTILSKRLDARNVEVARLRERVKTLTRAVEELEFEKEAGFEKPLQKDVPPAPPSASSAPAAPPRPSPASLADDVLARQVEVAVISGARGANALIPPGPVPTLDAQVQTDPVVIGGRGQAQTQVQQGTPQLQPETVKPSPSQQPRPGGGPKAIEFTVPTVPVTDTRPSSKGPEERLKSPSPAVVASPTALKSMRATSVSPLSAVSGEGGGEEDVSVRDYDGVDIGRVSSSVGDVSRPSSRLPLQSFGAVGAGAGGLSSAAEADSSMMGQSQDPDDPNTVTDTPTGTAAGAGPGSVPASSKGSPGKPSQSRSKSPLKPPAEDDAIGLGYTADDKVGYGSLFDVAKGKGGTGGGGMLFSPKLTRAEALARFRRRFHVPLEWEELAGDTAQGAYPLGGRLGRSALHHTLWGMLVDRWMAEEAVRRDGGEPEPFSGFVVNQLLFKFGTRPLAQARLSSLIASLGASFEQDRLPYFFSRFCGLTEALPLDCLTKMLRVIAVACDDVWMTPATTTKYMLSALLSSTRTTVAFVSLYDDRRWRVNVSLIKAVEAVRAVGTVIPCADVTLAEAWLYGFAMFPVLELPKVNTGSDDEDEPPALPERLARNIRAMVEYIGNLESALDPSKSVGPPSLRRKRNSSKKLLSTTPRDINQGDTDEELRVPEFPGRLAEQQEFMSALLRVMRKRELPAGTPAHIDPPADPDLVDPPMWSPPSSAALLKTPLSVLADGTRRSGTGGSVRVNLAVTGAEVDFSRVPSLRVPPLVTVPSRKGALMLDSPLPKVEPKAVKGGGRSTGTVDVAAITVGGSLGSPDDAFDPGFVVDAVPPPGVPDSSDPAPPAVPPSPITMRSPDTPSGRKKLSSTQASYVYPPSPSVVSRPASARKRVSTARRNAFPSTTHINVVDVMEVVVVMWLEARHRSSENLAALFETILDHDSESGSLGPSSFERLLQIYVGEPDRLVNTPLRISPAIPVASQTAVKSDVTSSTAGPDNLTQLIVDADKVDEELRKAGEALYKEAIVRTQGRPISLGLFQALSQGFLQGALRSAVASSKRLRRRLQAPPALDKPAAFPIVRPASPEQTPARQPVPSEGNASAVQGWDA